MHPFFKPVLAKENSSSVWQQNGSLDDTPKDCDESLQHERQKIKAESGVWHTSSKSSTRQNVHEHKNDDKDVENNIDPNLERRKRRKTTPFEVSKEAANPEHQALARGDRNEDGSWLEQLQGAANSGSAIQESGNAEAETTLLPMTPSGGSPVKLAIRKSPMKTPHKATAAAETPVRSPSSTVRPNTRSSSSVGKDVITPGSGATFKKKVIKLTSKGKLLSSPPSISPASKRKARSKTGKTMGKATLEPRKIICVGYGKDDDSRKRIGNQIDTILSQKAFPSNHDRAKTPEPPKVTHPFFLGKSAKSGKQDVIVIDDGSMTGQNSDTDERVDDVVVKPKDWKDLGFKKSQTSTVKVLDTFRPLWPPKDMQHLGVANLLPVLQYDRQASAVHQKSSKSRRDLLGISDDEDLLQRYATTLKLRRGQPRDAFPLPQKVILSRQEMINLIKGQISPRLCTSPGSITLQDAYPAAFTRLQLLFDRSSTDIGIPGIAHSWLSKSAPMKTEQVLQIQGGVLREWLASHQIHHTATKLSAAPKVKTIRKKRKKKNAGELNDFIVTSDDEDADGSATTKHALLMTGPNGCGKTASVYAAAKELDFEVFEIYPGMRRSAKDIFDKVGDMTQNHLVHKAAQLDQKRGSTPDAAIVDISSGESNQSSKNAMKSFLGGKKQNVKEMNGQSRTGTPRQELGQKPQIRKQSLILFEEVDILFEEDRGFWSGVIQLIEQSKRPAVLTCNNAASVPVEDLPLYATLEYEQVPIDVAVDYILTLAAAEGHWLEREAIYSLYLAKKMDLRATISELDFWCQMAIGSEKAGLDWIIERCSSDEAMKDDGEKLKLFSKGTYTIGMGLVPRTLFIPSRSNHGALLQYVQDELDIPLQYWHEGNNHAHRQPTEDQLMKTPTLDKLQQIRELADARSVLDLLNSTEDSCSDTEHAQHGAIVAEISASILTTLNPQEPPISIRDIVSVHLQMKAATSQVTPSTISAAFEPLMAEKPQFPPSSGRLAPSLDTSCAALMSDIAPYVRSIVHYDQRLEEQRYALARGSQTAKVRKTRAARAALEGGSKASTRDEKWFPKKTDYAAVLRTGGYWPTWSDDIAMPSSSGSSEGDENRIESSAPSPTADVVMNDGA